MTENERMTRWIAEKVMGWPVETFNDWYRLGTPSGALVFIEDEDAFFFAEKPHSATQSFSPTTNKSDAIDAMEAWCAVDDLNRDYAINKRAWVDKSRRYHVTTVEGSHIFECRADTVALAICKALCAATGMPEGDGNA